MNEYHLEKYIYDKHREWDSFVEESNNGTIFHRQDFLSYHPADRFNRDDKMIYRGNKLVGVLPLSYRIDDAGKIGMSPYGGSFGGIVIKDINSLHIRKVVLCLLQGLQNDNYIELNICFPPDCYYKYFNANLEYIFLKVVDHELIDRGLSSVIELNEYHKYNENYLRNLRKAEKAQIKVIVTEEVEPFYNILRETIINKHGSKPTHTIDELKYLIKYPDGKTKIFLGVLGEKVISGMLVFENSSPCVCAFYNCHTSEYAHTCSLHKVLDYVVKYFKGAKRSLDLGLTDRFSSSCNWGLFQFKEGAGARGYFRNYYKVKLSTESVYAKESK